MLLADGRFSLEQRLVGSCARAAAAVLEADAGAAKRTAGKEKANASIPD